MVRMPASPPALPLPLTPDHVVSKPAPRGFILPDLVSHCDFLLSYNPHGDVVAAESDNWLDDGCPELTPKARKALYGLHAGELVAFCYTSCDAYRLRVVTDFMNYLFHLDNISDGMLTTESDTLGDIVMNALWLPEAYKPTGVMAKEEVSAGKLARE